MQLLNDISTSKIFFSYKLKCKETKRQTAWDKEERLNGSDVQIIYIQYRGLQ